MPANTPRGFPYPLPTEPVAEGAAAMRALAEKLDAYFLPQVWIPLPFSGTWHNAGGGKTIAAYYKDPFGIVHLKGAAAGGANASLIGIVPVGYRPADEQRFAIAGAWDGSAERSGYITVDLGGGVYAHAIGSGPNLAEIWLAGEWKPAELARRDDDAEAKPAEDE